MVYEYALVDRNYSVRFRWRGTPVVGTRCIIRVHRRDSGHPNRDDSPGQTHGSLTEEACYITTPNRRPGQDGSELAVALPGTCKQINEEAAAVFYGQHVFSFDDLLSCFFYTDHIKAQIPSLRLIALRLRYYWPRNVDSYMEALKSWFKKLRSAINLGTLFVKLKFWAFLSGSPNMAAKNFFSLIKGWMRDLNTKHNNILAIIKLPQVVKTAQEACR